MQLGRMTGGLLLAVLIGGGVAALTLRESSHEHVVHAAPAVTIPESLPTDLPERPESNIRNAEQAALYQAGAADEHELEDFWRSCSMIEPDHLEQIIGELELRVRFFESLYIQRPNGQASDAPPPDGPVTQEEFMAYYGRIGLEEARFLLEECIAGRIRRTPFHPIPPTTLDNSHELAQLVPHISPTLDSGFVARLEYVNRPQLFDDRPVAYEVAQRVFQDGGDAEARHRRAADEERSATGR